MKGSITTFVVLSCAATLSLSAQQSQKVDIQRAALRHLVSELPKGQIIVDDNVSDGAGDGVAQSAKSQRGQFANDIPGSIVERGAPHIVCRTPRTPSSCRLDVAAIVSISNFQMISANEARLILSVRTQSSSAHGGTPREDFRVHLVRRGAAWFVTDRVLIAQS